MAFFAVQKKNGIDNGIDVSLKRLFSALATFEWAN